MPISKPGDDARPPGLSAIASRQLPDGGWGYGRDAWTEPTALALLALSTEASEQTPAVRAGIEWLLRARRSDGGWPPNPRVDQSVTWATSLALLALNALTGEPCTSSVQWLLNTSGREGGMAFRLIQLFKKDQDRGGFEGWPWYPGTTAWVAPTAMAIRALEKTRASQPSHMDRGIRERVELGRNFLMARRCLDGGWNHGSSRPLGYEAESYAETTGVALLGLTGVPREALVPSLRRAEAEFTASRSAQGRAWLRLALVTHGHGIPPGGTEPAGRDVTDVAVNAIAQAAQQGRNVFLA
jgi:hypothetical protein